MNPEERRLITDLFDRMRAMGGVEKDSDAASLITEELRRHPDAGYMLVQTVLVQEQALARADEKIRELENTPASEPQSERSAFGGASVPRTSARTSVPLTHQSPAARDDRDGNDDAKTLGRRARNDGGWGGGGFLGTALTTAAGVAGGMLLAESIRGLFNDPAADAKPTEASHQDNSNQNADSDGGARDSNVQDADYHDDGGGDGWDLGEMDI